LSIKTKVALPKWLQLEAEDEFAVVDIKGNMELGKLQYGQWLRMNEAPAATESGELAKANVYRQAILIIKLIKSKSYCTLSSI
jgi:hypothetical protein